MVSADRVSATVFNCPICRSHSMEKIGTQDSLQTNNYRGNEMLSLDAFFLHTTRLYCVVDEISHSISSSCVVGSSNLNGSRFAETDTPGSRMLLYLITINQLDQKLVRWSDKLPDHLKFHLKKNDEEDSVLAPIKRKRDVLHARFLWLRTLLHRQSLLYLLQRSESRPLPIVPPPHQWRPLFSEISIESEMSAHCKTNATPSPLETAAAQLNAGLFVSSAKQLIELLALTDNHAGGWWFNFHCRYPTIVSFIGYLTISRHRCIRMWDPGGYGTLQPRFTGCYYWRRGH